MCASQDRKILDRFQPNFQQTNQISLYRCKIRTFEKKFEPFCGQKAPKILLLYHFTKTGCNVFDKKWVSSFPTTCF